MRHRLLMLVLLGLLAAGVVGAARATAVPAALSANYDVPRSSLATGAQTAASANYAIQSTAGQTAVGVASSATYTACSGFWCQVQAALAAQTRLFLPLVRR